MIISRPNKNPNLFVQMDSVYINNFSYQNIDEKFTELLNKYSTEEVLNYLVARLQVPNVDHNIMKFLYPLFKLPEDVVDKNIDKVISALNDSIIEFMVQFMGKEKVQKLMTRYLEYHLYNLSYTNIESIRNMEELWEKIEYPRLTDTNKDFSELYKEVFASEEVQDALTFAIKYISNNLDDFNKELKGLLIILLENINENRLSSIRNSLLKFIKGDDGNYNNKDRRSVIREIFKQNLFDDELLKEVIQLINTNEDRKEIYSIFCGNNRLKEKLFSSVDANNIIDIPTFVSVAKSIDLKQWEYMLKYFDELGMDVSTEKDTYVKKVTNNLLKWQNLKIFYKSYALDYFLELIKIEPERYEKEISALAHHIINYKYRVWRVRFNDPRRWLLGSISKETYYQKALIVLQIGKVLIELYGLSDKVDTFVHYVIESPENSILLDHLTKTFEVQKNTLFVEKAVVSLNQYLDNLKYNEDGDAMVPFDTLSLLALFLIPQKHDDILTELLKFNHPVLSHNVTTAYAKGLFK